MLGLLVPAGSSELVPDRASEPVRGCAEHGNVPPFGACVGRCRHRSSSAPAARAACSSSRAVSAKRTVLRALPLLSLTPLPAACGSGTCYGARAAVFWRHSRTIVSRTVGRYLAAGRLRLGSGGDGACNRGVLLHVPYPGGAGAALTGIGTAHCACCALLPVLFLPACKRRLVRDARPASSLRRRSPRAWRRHGQHPLWRYQLPARPRRSRATRGARPSVTFLVAIKRWKRHQTCRAIASDSAFASCTCALRRCRCRRARRGTARSVAASIRCLRFGARTERAP